ncbi:hypothetical protein MOO46_05975 [Apilactobacillus apisilvae]|uniref:Uncharacterized protein n=1 Tax=Apilactobacillus apisilvae TaxID=2923364 RepID=A0ABY4PG58_9LACO|nr:hypothetical protein [Apilactobacillus apisilvae]UQS84791.1 hypothetical protein MOO46_05975 [Apilactobacillus apisilvae]
MKDFVSKNYKSIVLEILVILLFSILGTMIFTNNANASSLKTKPATYYYTLENENTNKDKDQAQTVLLKAKEGQKITVKAPTFKGYSTPVKKVTFVLWHGKFVEDILSSGGGINPYTKDSHIKNGVSKVTSNLGSNIPNAKVKTTNEKNIISDDFAKGTLPDTYVSPNYGHFNTRTIKYYIQSNSKKDRNIWKSAIKKIRNNGTLKFIETNKQKANLILKNSNIKYSYSWTTNLNKKHVITKGSLTFNKNRLLMGDTEFTPIQGILLTVGLKQNKYWDSMLYKNRPNLPSNLSQGDKAGLAKAYKNVK